MLVVSHLGGGDHLVQQGIYRSLASEYDTLLIPCYNHNLITLRHMLSDLLNVRYLCINHEREMLEFAAKAEVFDILRLGYYTVNDTFDKLHWDQEMYRQANVPFSERWSAFMTPKPIHMATIPQEPYDFVHDDLQRGYLASRYTTHNAHLLYRPTGFDSLFDYVPIIAGAEQIHYIDSAFLCLVDSLPDDPSQQLFFHKYARPDGLPPTLKRNWEIL